MGAIIRVNGTELPESLVIVDTLSNEVTLETILDSDVKLNMDEIHVEVNIFGNVIL